MVFGVSSHLVKDTGEGRVSQNAEGLCYSLEALTRVGSVKMVMLVKA